MNQYLYFISRYTKEPFSLNHLETFVHQRCRVNGNLRSHIPCRVLESIGSSDMLQLFMGKSTEWSTRTSEKNLLNLVRILTNQTLEDSTMLAVHRQDRHVILLSQLKNQLASYDKCLLVCQTYLLLCFDSMDCWSKTRIANHRCKYHIY